MSVVCVLALLPALPEETRSVSRTPGVWPGRLPSPTDLPYSAGSNLHSTYWAPLHHEPGQNTQTPIMLSVTGDTFRIAKSLFHKKVLNWKHLHFLETQTWKCEVLYFKKLNKMKQVSALNKNKYLLIGYETRFPLNVSEPICCYLFLF